MKNNKIVRYIKKHSSAAVGIGVFILVIIALLLFKDVFMFDEFKAIYGTRLDGIDKVKITKETKDKVTAIFKDSSSSAKVRLAGRIIYIDVVLNDDVSRDTAKDLGNKTLEVLSDQEKSYYDIQLLINNKANQGQFPIIGYKHHTRDAIIWNKDR